MLCIVDVVDGFFMFFGFYYFSVFSLVFNCRNLYFWVSGFFVIVGVGFVVRIVGIKCRRMGFSGVIFNERSMGVGT